MASLLDDAPDGTEGLPSNAWPVLRDGRWIDGSKLNDEAAATGAPRMLRARSAHGPRLAVVGCHSELAVSATLHTTAHNSPPRRNPGDVQ